MSRAKRVLLVVVVLLALGVPLGVATLGPGEPAHARSAKQLIPVLDEVRAAVAAGDQPRAKETWAAFQDAWLALEDPIRERDVYAYRAIEDAMFDAGASVREWNAAEARTALDAIHAECTKVAALGGAAPKRPRADLATFRAALAQADASPDVAKLEALQDLWVQVEAQVAARSARAYGSCEAALADARAAVRATPPDAARARGALAKVGRELAPIGDSASVGALDAASILLREGAEALLVLIAIASYLGRMGARAHVRTVWAGGIAGVIASLAAGALLVKLFTGVTAGARREVVEGAASLTAAVLLVVVGTWLHAHVKKGGWKAQVQGAVERGSGLSLFLVAFLAVFREGAETVVFFAGIAPASTPRDLFLGAAIGLAGLVVLGAAVVTLGRRVPLATFFSVATTLLWVLAIKFVGAGVHALQAGGVVSQTPFAELDEVPLLGFAPTVETCGAQLAAILAWVAWSLVPKLRRRPRVPHPELVEPERVEHGEPEEAAVG